MSSFGETLKRERELRQISLREISEATKINLRYLDALERNDFRHLPGGVFNKGFVRAYAQFIGIDPEAMAMAYLEEEQRQQARAQRPVGGESAAPVAVESRRPTGTHLWVIVVVALLLLFVVVAGLTALGYGPLAYRFKTLRSADRPSAAVVSGSVA
jgi:cytoskeletal protein RodZ